jgi:hypothetical protein
VKDRTRDPSEPAQRPSHEEIPLARDVTTCVLDFVRDRATPIAEWVSWTGGAPELVILVVTETLRSIADGLEDDPTGGLRRAAVSTRASALDTGLESLPSQEASSRPGVRRVVGQTCARRSSTSPQHNAKRCATTTNDEQ